LVRLKASVKGCKTQLLSAIQLRGPLPGKLRDEGAQHHAEEPDESIGTHESGADEGRDRDNRNHGEDAD
jgi:hypothetical protein